MNFTFADQQITFNIPSAYNIIITIFPYSKGIVRIQSYINDFSLLWLKGNSLSDLVHLVSILVKEPTAATRHTPQSARLRLLLVVVS